MTGFGEAHRQADGVSVAVEVRTINSKYFKLSVRSAEGYSALEPDIEQLVRKQIKRGTLQVTLRVDRPHSPDDFRINPAVLEGYRRQLADICRQWQVADGVGLDKLLLLPGVVNEDPIEASAAEEIWPLIAAALEAALANLAQMRVDEGRAMSADLKVNLQIVAAQLALVEQRAPLVVESYRKRLEDRLRTLLAERDVGLAPADVIREVSIFAERSDISEEIIRLRSHLVQFESLMAEEESSGRKLDFLTQEMFREANTIGSKANDAEISRQTIEIKASIEKIREMVQNVE
jgi:uncharacterized protein (TIGR00255 family)